MSSFESQVLDDWGPPGEFERARGDSGSFDWFVGRCSAGLETVHAAVAANIGADRQSAHRECVRLIIRTLAVLIASEQMPPTMSVAGSIRRARQAVLDAALGSEADSWLVFSESVRAAHEMSRMDIFAPPDDFALPPGVFADLARTLLRSRTNAPIEPIFFQTAPSSWLGLVYQVLLALRPTASGTGLEWDRTLRKRAGVYFTPACLVSYVVEGALPPLLPSRDSLRVRESESGDYIQPSLKVLDPAMGGGDFLCRVVDFLCGSDEQFRASVAAECVYGVDIDPVCVEIARFCVWAASGYAEGISDSIDKHLVLGDALGYMTDGSETFDWQKSFPDVFDRPDAPGFDAVIGNPPYIASKNGFRNGTGCGAGRGQSDSYLMFLATIMDMRLVRPGGILSMVLPDPMLVRENAASIRRGLLTEWTILSVLHISGVFADAGVANIVPICRNTPGPAPTFGVSRIERAADRRSFALRPLATARSLERIVRTETMLSQDRCEFLYLLEDGDFGEIIRRIHGDSLSLSSCKPPFAPLRDLNVKVIYRGEEIGKAAINQGGGDLPILLGGQSVQPYEVVWEGRKTNRSEVRKPIERYASTKILIQKSSAHLIAALDRVSRRHPGYVFPQSVYAVELRPLGMHELYLLCVMNSEVMNEYVRRTVTGYKFLQPQLEIEDIRALPIRRISFITHSAEREAGLSRAVGIFEDESLKTKGTSPFSELADFVVKCLTGNPEKSDVVHDLLVHLGRLMVDLTKSSRKSPDADTTRRLISTRRAIETVVWRLYSSRPAQMSLPW